ncbi:MAG: AsmA-like C-terminal domain-containing protein [Elstera sp.]
MIDGITRHGLRALLAVLVLIIGLFGYGAYRLSQGPVPLDFALEPLEKALSFVSGHTIKVSRAALSWNREIGDLGLDLGGVSLSTREGSRLLTLPTAWLEISGPELLRGRVQPTVLLLTGLTLRGRRAENGSFSLGVQAEADAPTPEASAPGTTEPKTETRSPTQWLTDVFKLGQPNGLRQVRLRDTRVVLLDERMNVEWRVNDISATVQADAAGNPLGGMDGALVLPSGVTRLTLDGRLDLADPATPDDDFWTVAVDVADLLPSAIAARLPGLAEMTGLEVPTQVKAKAVLDSAGHPQTLSATLTFGAGRLVHGELPKGVVAVTEGEIGIELKQGRLDIDLTRFTLGTGASLKAKIAVDRLQFPLQVDATLAIKSVALADLPDLWPVTVAPNPRRWILANLSKGSVSEAAATLKAVLPSRDAEPEVQALTATLKAANIDVTYLGKLPPVEGVGGALTYTHSDGRLAMTLQDGRVRGGLTVPSGTISITGLKAKDQQMALAMVIEGPVAEALSLLDQPPLGFMKRFGIDPKQSQGTAQVNLRMGFPLLDALKVEQLEIAADATLTQAALKNVIEDVSLSAADLLLKVTPTGLTGSGTGKLNGVGFQIGWTESFTDTGGRSLTLVGTVNDAGRTALKLPGEGYVSGPIDLNLAYLEPKPRQAKVTVKADLTQARVQAEDILYTKLPGEGAQLTADLVMENNRLTQISTFNYRTATGRGAEGSIQFDNKMDVSEAVLRRVQLPGTDLSGTLKRGRDGWIIGLEGRSLDLTAFMAEQAKKPPSAAAPLSLSLTAKLDKLVLGPKREAQNVSARVHVERDVWRELGFNAKIGQGNASATIRGAGKDRRLSLEAADAGAFLAFGGIIDTVRGGVLTVNGLPDAEGWRGQAKMSAYRLLEEPVLGRILAIASITGIPELLQGEGIAFETASLDYRVSPQKITLANGRTTGLSVGLKLDGTINRTTEKLDLYGTIVPMAGINRVIAAIPLLGTILTGGDGGGVFAWTFTVTGQMADPQVSVNPLSGFAPGILRSIFEGSSSSSEDGNGDGTKRPPPPQFNPSAGDR